MEVERHWSKVPGRVRGWAGRHRLLAGFMALALALPVLLSPTHPVAVYGYLADTYVVSFLFAGPNRADVRLRDFLIAPVQIDHYRTDLREDMLDTRSGRLFAIVCGPGGIPEQHPVRTWNSFLPTLMPAAIKYWLDHKEISYLGDLVALWRDFGRIQAMGHYHPFGGGPSHGDERARRFSRYAEVVVSNGLIPMVYLQGELVPYGNNIRITNDVFRSLRALERSIVMDNGRLPPISAAPSDQLKSFLAFLETYRNVDIDNKVSVARGVGQLCDELRLDFGPVFSKGFRQSAYADSQDKANFVLNLLNLELWAVYVTNPPVRHVFPAEEVRV